MKPAFLPGPHIDRQTLDLSEDRKWVALHDAFMELPDRDLNLGLPIRTREDRERVVELVMVSLYPELVRLLISQEGGFMPNFGSIPDKESLYEE